jgi:hypothetical protein
MKSVSFSLTTLLGEKMDLFADIANVSLPIRHSIVKLIAPKLYQGSSRIHPPLRGTIEAIKQKFLNQAVNGVEIGVFKGCHAENILKTLNVETIYLVDPYESYVDNWDQTSSEALTNAYFSARRKLAKYQNKVVWVKKPSEQAVNSIPDNLDFVYIDGNHNYSFVKKDIQLYYPKIKRGGILGGHNFEIKFMGVAQAVVEFTVEQGLTLQGKAPCDWWIEKK